MCATWTHLELAPDASVLRTYTHIHTNTILRARYSENGGEERGTTDNADGRRSERPKRQNNGRDIAAQYVVVVVGVHLRGAVAHDPGAISSNSSSRSIEVQGRKQAPFYPVHSRQRERWTDGGAPRARRDGTGTGTGRERECTCSSLALRSYSRPLALAPAPHRRGVANRLARTRPSSEEFAVIGCRAPRGRDWEYPRTFNAHFWDYHHFHHCRKQASSLRRRDVYTFRKVIHVFASTNERIKEKETVCSRRTYCSEGCYCLSSLFILALTVHSTLFFLSFDSYFLLLFFFLPQFVFRDARTKGDAPSDGQPTVVRYERTRTEAPSDDVERWRLPGWFPPRTAIRPSYTSAATRAAPSPCCQLCSLLLSLRPPRFSRTFLPSAHPTVLFAIYVCACVCMCVRRCARRRLDGASSSNDAICRESTRV